MNRQLRLLAMELGSANAGRGVIEELRRLIPGVWVAGVEKTVHHADSVFDLVVTNQQDAFFGRYPSVDVAALAVTPELNAIMAPYEGKLLNVAGLASVRSVMDYPKPIRGVPIFKDSYEARKDLLDRHIRFWNHILDTHSIDAVVHENLGQEVFDYVALQVARAKGIPTLVFNISGQFPCVLFVQENEHGLGNLDLGTDIKSRIGLDLTAENPSFIRRSVQRFETSPDAGIGISDTNREYHTSPVVSWLFDRSIYRNNLNPFTVISAIGNKIGRGIRNPAQRLRVFRRSRSLLSQTRRAMREERATCKVPNLENPYIYFPLHFQPETSTSIKGQHFFTLREAVAFLASELPAGWQLIVKEHPHQFRRLLKRVEGFYSQIAAVPNVTLVTHTADNGQLTAHARAVACVSHSSITAHAAFSGKPVLSLGDSHFREAPNYYCIQTSNELRSVMSLIENGDTSVAPSKVETFLKRLEGGTFEGEFGEQPSNMTDVEWSRIQLVTRSNISKVLYEWLKLKQLVD